MEEVLSAETSVCSTAGTTAPDRCPPKDHAPSCKGQIRCGIKPACRNSATRPSPLERVSSDEPGAPMRNCTTALQNSIGGAWSYPQIRTSCGKSGSHF